MRPMSDLFTVGQWQGERVNVVGGGPSRSRFFTEDPPGRVISVNAHYGSADVIVSGDQMFLKKLRDHQWETVVDDVPIVCVDVGGNLYLDQKPEEWSERAYVLPALDRWRFWSHSMSHVRWAANSGISAINLADLLVDGHGTLHLYGFDCDGPKPPYPWFRTNFADIMPLVRADLLFYGGRTLSRLFKALV